MPELPSRPSAQAPQSHKRQAHMTGYLRSAAGTTWMLGRFTRQALSLRSLSFLTEELAIGVVAGALAAYLPQFTTMTSSIALLGAAEAGACIALLGLELAGVAVVSAYLSDDYFVPIAEMDEGGFQSDMHQFHLAAFLSMLAALCGGVEVLWSASALPEVATRGIVGFGAMLSATAAVAGFKLAFMVGQWNVNRMTLRALAYRGKMHARAAHGDQDAKAYIEASAALQQDKQSRVVPPAAS